MILWSLIFSNLSHFLQNYELWARVTKVLRHLKMERGAEKDQVPTPSSLPL